MKKNRILMVFCLIFAVVTVAVSTAHSQGNATILFNGTTVSGQISGFNQLEAEKTVFPGVELRFNDNGRVAFGIAYQRWELEQDPTHVSFSVFRQDKELLVSYDESSDARGNVVFASVYVNITTHGKVRPFVGGGPGIGIFRISNRIRNIVDVVPPFFESGTVDTTSTESRTKILAKGVAGLNIYPTKHFVISLGGGYLNGPAVTFGAGVTF